MGSISYGGVGRTGTVVGCHLVRRHGLSGREALKQLHRLWQRNERAGRSPLSPEMPDQESWVKDWREPAA